jgi:hypothetical protein
MPGYLAGDDGTVKGKTGRLLRLHKSNGYLAFAAQVGGREIKTYAHIAVCEAFHGARPEGLEVAHENGVRHDNRPENLKWKTRADNHADKKGHGTHLEGEDISWSVLTEEKVREIKKLGHLSTPVVGKMYGVSPAAIWLIRAGRNWKDEIGSM